MERTAMRKIFYTTAADEPESRGRTKTHESNSTNPEMKTRAYCRSIGGEISFAEYEQGFILHLNRNFILVVQLHDRCRGCDGAQRHFGRSPGPAGSECDHQSFEARRLHTT